MIKILKRTAAIAACLVLYACGGGGGGGGAGDVTTQTYDPAVSTVTAIPYKN